MTNSGDLIKNSTSNHTGNNNGGDDDESNNNLIIFHQNIRCLINKSEELIVNLDSINFCPHILCISEHHLKQQELITLSVHGYILGAEYSRKVLHKGGVCIYTKQNLIYKVINLSKFCIEQNIELCAIQFDTKQINVVVICVYRAPTGDFEIFLKQLENALKFLFKPNREFIICGDINIDYLTESTQKYKLNSMLITFNMSHTVNFATRIAKDSSSAIDNIFINNNRLQSFAISSVINGLSDHDAQVISL